MKAIVPPAATVAWMGPYKPREYGSLNEMRKTNRRELGVANGAGDVLGSHIRDESGILGTINEESSRDGGYDIQASWHGQRE